MFQYWVFVVWLLLSLLLFVIFSLNNVFSFNKGADFSDLLLNNKRVLSMKNTANTALLSGLELVSIWWNITQTSGFFTSQDAIILFNNNFVFPRLWWGALDQIELIDATLSWNQTNESVFSRFFQTILVAPLSYVRQFPKIERYNLSTSLEEYFGLGCLQTDSSWSFVCKDSLTRFLKNFATINYNQTEITTPLSQYLAQIYPKIRYSDEYKELLCKGVVDYLELGGSSDSKLTELMASCDPSLYTKYTLLRQAAEIRDGFNGGISDSNFYYDPRLNQYKLFSFQQLIYMQIKSSSQTESIIGSYLDYWINLLKKEHERENLLLDIFSKNFSHRYHQKILIPYLRAESANITTEQKTLLLSKLLQVENGHKNWLFKGIVHEKHDIKPIEEVGFEKINLDDLFRANLPVQFVLTSTAQTGENLLVIGQDQLTKLNLEADLKYDGAKLYVAEVRIPKNLALTDIMNTLLSADKTSFVGMLLMLKENLTIAEQNEKLKIDFCALAEKELGKNDIECTPTHLTLMKNKTQSWSGVKYQFALKDMVLQSVQISDKQLENQILQELDFTKVNKDTTLATIKRILNYEIKKEESWFGAKEQILVNDLFIKYFKQKPTKVQVSGSLIKVWFTIKEVKFIGYVDIATNRLSQISLDFGEEKPLWTIQKLSFDLNNQSLDKINAFLLDPVDYLRKLNSRLVDKYFKDGVMSYPEALK